MAHHSRFSLTGGDKGRTRFQHQFKVELFILTSLKLRFNNRSRYWLGPDQNTKGNTVELQNKQTTGRSTWGVNHTVKYNHNWTRTKGGRDTCTFPGKRLRLTTRGQQRTHPNIRSLCSTTPDEVKSSGASEHPLHCAVASAWLTHPDPHDSHSSGQ